MVETRFQPIKSVRLLVVVFLAAVAMCAAMLFATPASAHADGEYTVHYETFGHLEYGYEIPDKTGVSWNDSRLIPGYNTDDYWEDDFTLVGWCIDPTLETPYTNQTYAQLAGDQSVQSITLYAKLEFYYYQRDNLWYHPWARSDSLPSSPGDYYLVRDVTLENADRSAKGAWTAPSGTTRLHLDGHSIRRAETSDSQGTIYGSVIHVPAGSTLELLDAGGNGKIMGGNNPDGNGGGILVEGTLRSAWCNITGNHAKNGGGIAVVGDGSANLRRAFIYENTASQDGGGVAVLGNGTLGFTGDIDDNSVGEGGQGGGVYVEPSSAKMSIGNTNGDWFADKDNWWPYVTISGNTGGDVFLSKSALEDGNCRIGVNSIKSHSTNAVGITLDEYPEADLTAETIFTSGLGSKEYGYFFLSGNPGDYQIRTTETNSGKEAAIGYTKYKVTFNVDGSTYREEYVLKGRTATKPADPERGDDVFSMWVWGNDNQEYDFNTPVTSNITLTALFEGDHFHDNHFYQAWSDSRYLPENSGYYYLTTDVNLGSEWRPKVNTDVHICLNGHNVQSSDTDGVIYLTTNYEYAGSWRHVDIYDCSEGQTGFIKGAANARYTVAVFSGCALTLHSGTIRGNESARGNLVYVGGSFNMKGGEITGNASSANGAGVRVSGDAGVFNMEGGTITGNTTSGSGGGVSVENEGTLNMKGGTITGNAAAVSGGGVFVSVIDEYDYVSHLKLTPSGEDIKITGNTVGGAANNVFLMKDVTTQSKIALAGEGCLTDGSIIGVTSGEKPTVEDGVVLTSGFEGRGALSNFVSDEEAYIFEEADGEVVIKLDPRYQEYPITYDLAGGALPEGTSNPETYMPANDAITLANPVREAYDFAGWTGTDLTEPTKTVTIPSGSSGERSYTATWTPTEYSITYRLNGGELPEGVTNPYSYTIESGDITLANPVLEGSEFSGWYLMGSEADETTEMVLPAGSKGNKTFIAIWGGADHGTHVLSKVEAQDPTCEDAGHAAYWVCDGGAHPCGKAFADEEGTVEADFTKAVEEGGVLIPALGHNWGGINYGFIDLYTKHHAYRTCKRDPTHKEEEIVDVTATVTTPATCTRKGTTTYTAGTYENPAFERFSGDSMSVENVPIDPNAHDYRDVAGSAVAATCTEPGKEADQKCSRCGNVVEGAEIAALGHDYQVVEGSAVAATCTEPGKEADQKCSRCGNVVEGAEIAATGHAWGDWMRAKEPTCTVAGIELRVCSNNTLHFETRDIDALGHDWGPWQTDSETATQLIESRVCARGDLKEKRTTTTTVKQNTVWTRIWGATAPITMQEIAKNFGKTNYAVVTTDSSYKDALAASALAGKCNGLVLMTKKDSLTAQTKTALKTSGVKTVYIVGSTANVTANVEKQLKSGTGVTKVVRVAATTPSQRAVAAAKVGGKKSDTVIIATQNGFQDALSIAPYSYATKSPILYAETSKKLSAETTSFIKSAGYKKAIVVGGPIALPASIDSQLKSAGVTSITRLAGANLYETSKQIADWTTGSLANGNYGTYQGETLAYVKFQPTTKLNANKLAVSTGQNWLDALSGAALCGKNRSVVLLADTKTAKSNYTIAVEWCAAHKTSIKNGYVLGGTSAVSKTVWDALVDSTKTITKDVKIEQEELTPTYTIGG